MSLGGVMMSKGEVYLHITLYVLVRRGECRE